MTETTFTSPRLERPHEAPVGGVCLALARTTGTEPVLWRVLFVVLCFFDFLGAALYLMAYCAIPREGEERSLAERVLRGPDRRVTTKQLLLLALVFVVAAGAFHANGGVVVAAAAAALGYVWWHRRHGNRSTPVPFVAPVAPAPTAAGPADPTSDTVVEAALAAPTVPLAPPPVWVPPAPRRRSVLTRLTLSAAALVVGVLLFVAAADGASIPAEVVLATALGVIGLGLVASAVWGRARGLVPVAFLLALALGGTVAARPALDHGVGERRWVAHSASGTFRLGIGDARLTLPTTVAEGSSGIVARVSLGHLEIVVPVGVHAVIDAHVQNGDIQGPGDVDENGRDVDHRFELGPRTAAAVYVEARVGAGMVEVRNA